MWNNFLRISAPAKINLSLHITGKRADGFHLLESLVAFTEFGDELEISPASDLTLKISGPFATSLIGNNLVMRAALLLQTHAGIKAGAAITLHKNIPIGAGLGGGSSDAAATLRGLMKLWNISIDDADLKKLALQLGSDVPVCLNPQTAIIRGIGEDITPVSLPKNIWLLLVNPGVPLLTADVYKHYSGPFDSPCAPPATDLMEFMGRTHNVLEKPAISLLPAISELLSAIAKTKGCVIARMSGSGATCFGLYNEQQEALDAMAALKQEHSWWATVTGLYGR